ncbi:MAG: hypothetical protein JNL42_04200 [Anaerolineae bacterium]|nr:hypothetical protein [Anaerolineae bacterium]
MRIPQNALILREKLTDYLLVRKSEDDKSQFLGQAGFTMESADALEAAIRRHIATYDAQIDRSNQFGEYYVVHGELVGVNEQVLSVTTVWIQDAGSERLRFITLKPRR